MKITELLKESQIQEGPLTQVIGKGFGKAAKNLAGVGKDLKTGFKAGYGSGDQAQTDPNAAPKQGIVDKVKQAASDFKQGFQQGSGKSSAPEQEKPETPAAEPASQDQTTAAPKPAAQSNDEVNVLKKEVDSIKTVIMKDIADLKQQVANLSKPASEPDTTPGFLKSATDKIRDRARQTQTQSVKRTGKPVNESVQLFRR